MQQLVKRTETEYLVHWAAQTARKPLVIRGARQVGKSTLVREFAKTAGFALLEINFERNPEFRDAFIGRDPNQILQTLKLLSGQAIEVGETLVFLDEIQAAPEALAALRYFYEEKPQLHVLAAGSLLEFALADTRFSMPVGRVEYMHLGPVRFEDFLAAMGRSELVEHLQNFSLADVCRGNIPKPVHEHYLSLLREYCIVGGLPEAVANYAQTRDFAAVARVQQSIVATYRDDFNKYSHGNLKDRVQLVFDQLPTLVGKKFRYVRVSQDHRAAELKAALEQLCMARIAFKVQHSSANGVPLAAEVNPRRFKTLFMDVGLICAALHLNVLDLSKQDTILVNNGAIAEQFVGQHLLYDSPYYTTPALYYWVREAKNAAAEIDYLITSGQHIVPVEIKAGTSGSLKSLHQFFNEKHTSFGLRLNADMPSLLRDTQVMVGKTRLHFDLLSLPLYMVGQIQRLLQAYWT